VGQAFAGQFGTLIDQNDRLVRYDVRFNRSELDFIIDNGFAATKTLTPSGPVSVLPTVMTLPDWAPQWILSTFEHIDNVPGKKGGPLDPSAWTDNRAFYDAECPGKVAGLEPDCADRPFLAAAPCCPNVPYDRRIS